MCDLFVANVLVTFFRSVLVIREMSVEKLSPDITFLIEFVKSSISTSNPILSFFVTV